MRASSDLFELIHALSASEKRYFRIFASRHVKEGQTNYMRIFDLIEAQAVHDEKAILASIEDAKLRSQFAVQKNYLHKFILRSLRSYYAEASVDFQIKECLINVELLLWKGLVRQSQKQLAKAEQLAHSHERYEVLSEIAGYKVLLLMKMPDADLDRIDKALVQTFEDVSVHLERLHNIHSYRRLSMMILMMNRRDPQAKTPESREAYGRIMNDPLMQSEEKALSKRALLYFRQSRFVHSFAKIQYEEAFRESTAIVQLMEQHPHLVSERPENYVIALQNCVMMSTFSQPLEVSRTLIAQLRAFATRFPDLRFDEATVRKVPVFAANIELRLLINHKQYDEAAACLPAMLAQLEGGYAYNVNEGYVIVDMYFMAASIHLYRRDFRQALGFVTKLMHFQSLNAEFEFFLDTRILNMVILFEMGETQLLESALLSLQRYLLQKHKLFTFEKVLIEFIRKASADLHGKPGLAHLRQLRDDLRAIVPVEGEEFTITQFDILAWLDTRLNEAHNV